VWNVRFADPQVVTLDNDPGRARMDTLSFLRRGRREPDRNAPQPTLAALAL